MILSNSLLPFHLVCYFYDILIVISQFTALRLYRVESLLGDLKMENQSQKYSRIRVMELLGIRSRATLYSYCNLLSFSPYLRYFTEEQYQVLSYLRKWIVDGNPPGLFPGRVNSARREPKELMAY